MIFVQFESCLNGHEGHVPPEPTPFAYAVGCSSGAIAKPGFPGTPRPGFRIIQ
jgi:hypothetical protein